MAIRDLIPRSRGEEGVTRYEPSAILSDLQREVNSLFESFPRGWMGLGNWRTGRYLPNVDVQETDKSVHVDAELPGMSEKDLEVSLTPKGDALILKGEKKMEHEREEKGVYRAERSYGAFERTVPLPATVDPNKVEATFKDGVLCIDLQKAPEAATRNKITIKHAD